MKIPNISGRGYWRAAQIGALIVVAIYLVNIVRMFWDFRQELTMSNNVRLTDRWADVRYRLGSPTDVLGPSENGGFRRVFAVNGPAGGLNTMPPETRLEDYGGWDYTGDKGAHTVTVEFDKAGKVDSITRYCGIADSLYGPDGNPLAGIRVGDDEEKVLSLGDPSNISIDGGVKTVEFNDIGVRFQLAKGKVYRMTLKRHSEDEWVVVRRFLHTQFP